MKLIVDDTLLFSVVPYKNDTASQFSNDLDKVTDWAYMENIF